MPTSTPVLIKYRNPTLKRACFSFLSSAYRVVEFPSALKSIKGTLAKEVAIFEAVGFPFEFCGLAAHFTHIRNSKGQFSIMLQIIGILVCTIGKRSDHATGTLNAHETGGTRLAQAPHKGWATPFDLWANDEHVIRITLAFRHSRNEAQTPTSEDLLAKIGQSRSGQIDDNGR